ncbi:MAG TPA: MBL fold metallo-hydrolase [Vicinamibacteria bacterium]|nr:MBL fold metallo-hydrolase [Vicinamibacteria bacterium]
MSLRFRVLGSGSSGNATLVEGHDASLLIDAGLGSRCLAERLQSAGVDPGSLAAVLVSHEHGDHARGAAAFSAKWGVRLCGSRGTYAAAGFGAVEIAGYDVLEAGESRRFGSVAVTAVPVPHDAAGPLAFVVASKSDRLGHATDFGHVGRPLVQAMRGCDAVLIESNYDPGLLRDGPYPWSLKERILGPQGHLSNGDVARFLAEGLGESCRTVVLAHLSQTNNHPELARMSAEEALRRRGRSDVRLELSGPEGTGWIEVRARGPEPAQRRGQLQLF